MHEQGVYFFYQKTKIFMKNLNSQRVIAFLLVVATDIVHNNSGYLNKYLASFLMLVMLVAAGFRLRIVKIEWFQK
jgi:hypothetical protein